MTETMEKLASIFALFIVSPLELTRLALQFGMTVIDVIRTFLQTYMLVPLLERAGAKRLKKVPDLYRGSSRDALRQLGLLD